MACTPSQSHHSCSDCQYQKDQPMFLWQINFPNLIKGKKNTLQQGTSKLESQSLCHCLIVIVFPPPFPQEMRITGQIEATSLQQLQVTPNVNEPFPFVHLLGLPYPLLGIFLSCLLPPLLSPSSLFPSILSLPTLDVFSELTHIFNF